MWLPCTGSCMQPVATMGPLASTGSGWGQGRVAFQGWLSRCGCTRTAEVLPEGNQGGPCLSQVTRVPCASSSGLAQWPLLSSLASFPPGQGLGPGGHSPSIIQVACGLCPPSRPCFLLQWDSGVSLPDCLAQNFSHSSGEGRSWGRDCLSATAQGQQPSWCLQCRALRPPDGNMDVDRRHEHPEAICARGHARWVTALHSSHPRDPRTQQVHHGCVDSLQMGTCMPWAVMTARHTWPLWRSMSPRCETPQSHIPLPRATSGHHSLATPIPRRVIPLRPPCPTDIPPWTRVLHVETEGGW